MNFTIKVQGFSRGAWAELANHRTDVKVEDDGSEEAIEDALEQMRGVVKDVYRENYNAYLQVGETSICILRFDALRITYDAE